MPKPKIRKKRTLSIQAELEDIDYKNADLLKSMLTENGKLYGRKMTGLSAKKQKKVSREVKKARILGLLPFLGAGN